MFKAILLARLRRSFPLSEASPSHSLPMGARLASHGLRQGCRLSADKDRCDWARRATRQAGRQNLG